MAQWLKGTDLSPSAQREALRVFANRFTRDHIPVWARRPRPDGSSYQPHFASDQDWLAHTSFAVTKTGRLDKQVRYCESSPTWPNGTPATAVLPNDDAPPTYCPHCGGSEVSEIGPWQASSLIEENNTSEVVEYQCRGVCEGRSFWA